MVHPSLIHIDPNILEDRCIVPPTTLEYGQNIWLHLFRHNQIIQYNTKPKTILYSLDIFTLDQDQAIITATTSPLFIME